MLLCRLQPQSKIAAQNAITALALMDASSIFYADQSLLRLASISSILYALTYAGARERQVSREIRRFSPQASNASSVKRGQGHQPEPLRISLAIGNGCHYAQSEDIAQTSRVSGGEKRQPVCSLVPSAIANTAHHCDGRWVECVRSQLHAARSFDVRIEAKLSLLAHRGNRVTVRRTKADLTCAATV
jgi:hypothetical protein